MWYSWMNEVIGAWLALAPLVSLDVPSVKLNNLYMGVLAAVVSAHTTTKRAWRSYLGIAAGAWVAFSSFFKFFVEGDGYLQSNVISGVVIFIVALIGLEEPKSSQQQM